MAQQFRKFELTPKDRILWEKVKGMDRQEVRAIVERVLKGLELIAPHTPTPYDDIVALLLRIILSDVNKLNDLLAS